MMAAFAQFRPHGGASAMDGLEAWQACDKKHDQPRHPSNLLREGISRSRRDLGGVGVLLGGLVIMIMI